MRIRIWLVLLILLVPSWAWAETLYVRPAADCANSGDGSAYACAASGGAAGAWKSMSAVVMNAADTAGQVDAGDTLKTCGSFVAADRDTANYHLFMTESGEAGNVITIDGDCSSDGGSSTSDWDGETSTLYGIGTHDETYITVKNLVLHDFTNRGALLYNHTTNDVTIDKHVTLTNLTIHDIRGSSDICIDGRGKNVTLTYLTIYNCGSDAIWHNGANLTVSYNTISQISVDAGNSGDGVQMSGTVDGAYIHHNSIDMSTVDSKYCGIFQGSTDNGSIRVTNNTCVALTNAVNGLGWRFDDLTGLDFSANYTTGGLYNANPNLIAASVYRIYGNVFLSPSQRCLSIGGTGAGIAEVYHNTCKGATTWGLMNSNTGGATVTFKNNLVSGGGALCINKRAANVEQYNLLYNCTDAVGNSDVAGSADGTDIVSDPLLISSTDLRTTATSTARRAGISGYLCKDVRGRACYPDRPDIGAYQSTSGDPAAARTAR